MDYKSYDEFVASGDWYLDTEAPDYKEQLFKDVKEQQQAETPQEAAKEPKEGWYEQPNGWLSRRSLFVKTNPIKRYPLVKKGTSINDSKVNT